jgi:transcriptional regulator with XRE-family HTH domain
MRAGDTVSAWRTLERKSLREAAEEIGIPRGVLFRFETGKTIKAEHLTRLIHWLLGPST